MVEDVLVTARRAGIGQSEGHKPSSRPVRRRLVLRQPPYVFFGDVAGFETSSILCPTAEVLGILMYDDVVTSTQTERDSFIRARLSFYLKEETQNQN